MYPELTVPHSVTTKAVELRQGIFCLDTMGHLLDGLVALYQCHHTGGNQEWAFTAGGYIKHHDLCLALVNFVKGLYREYIYLTYFHIINIFKVLRLL